MRERRLMTLKKGARNFAIKFYKSKDWKKKSIQYRKEHPLCERCLKKGLYERSTLVHHKVHIDATNYRDPAILLDDKNLEALCDKCHAEEHNPSKPNIRFNPDGSLII